MNKTALNSKKIIVETLIDLMKDNSFSEITISEIAAYSNLSRSSFYRNFSSKLEVLSYYNGLILEEYFKCVNEKKIHTFREMLDFHFEFWISKKTYLMLLKKNNIYHTLFEIQRDKFLKKFSAREILSYSDEIDETVILLFMVGGLWNTINYYLDVEENLDPKELASNVFNNLMLYMKKV